MSRNGPNRLKQANPEVTRKHRVLSQRGNPSPFILGRSNPYEDPGCQETHSP
jgi:hypothetical protein